MLTKELQAEYETAKAYLATAPDPAQLCQQADELERQVKGLLATLKGTVSEVAYADHQRKYGEIRQLRNDAAKADKDISTARNRVAHAESLLQADDAIKAARRQWKQASAAHVDSTQTVRKAEEALAHLRQLIEREQAELTKAQGGQRGSILASFGLAPEGGKSVLSVADIQARIDALESVLPEHQAAVDQAKAQHQRTDAATHQAEKAILQAKASQAERDEALAFEQFKAAHLRAMAAAHAAGQKFYVRQDWHARIYGAAIDGVIPSVTAIQTELIAQAEQGD